MSIREHIVDTNDDKGTFHFVKTQDCESIMKAIKELPDHVVHRANTQSSHNLVGSVPNIVALNWAQEWGVKLYSKEWLEKTSHRLKNDPQWSALRAEQRHRY